MYVFFYRDLRHLRSYAIDREGASEVDDALSVEYLDEKGVSIVDRSSSSSSSSSVEVVSKVKLWIHIADVSRWIKPGSQLSLEAERRMSSIYMPGNIHAYTNYIYDNSSSYI
jgi:exoribonuclease R